MRVVIGAVVGVLMVTLLLSTPLLGALDLIGFSSEESTFEAKVDYPVGTNIYTLVEIDEGDNNEETSITIISHEFVFSATSENAAITWDFGDGNTASGAITSHQYDEPGEYVVLVTSITPDAVETTEIPITVHLEASAEVDNMECECAPTAKDTVIDLLALPGSMEIEGYVQVEHDGSSESCSLRNPLQECHLRVILQRTEEGSVVGEDVLFDDTFRSNELVVDFSLMDEEFEEGEGLQLRLETDQLRDWHKPMAAWSSTAPVSE